MIKKNKMKWKKNTFLWNASFKRQQTILNIQKRYAFTWFCCIRIKQSLWPAVCLSIRLSVRVVTLYYQNNADNIYAPWNILTEKRNSVLQKC